MVHALQDIWRVLLPGGYLIDMRPHAISLPVEVIAGDAVLSAGAADASPSESDTIAADESVAEVVRAGFFVRERDARFDYGWTWDTVAELRAFMEDNWTRTTILESTMVRLEELTAANDAGARVRVRRNIIIARYRKQPVPPSG